MNQVGQSTQAITGATHDASLKFTELNSALELAKKGYEVIVGTVKSVMDPTVALADQVRRLTLDIGATPQEASKFIYAADAMNISTQSLTVALDAAIKKGHAPTIDALAAEADKYTRMQDPVARTKMLVEDFGRSGAQLGPLMALGSAGIKALGEEASRAGVVLDKDGLTALLHYQLATKELDQSWLGLKTDIAEAVSGPLTAAIQDIASHVQVMTLATKAWQEGKLSLGGFAGEMLQLETKGLMPATDMVDQLTKKLATNTQGTLDAGIATSAYSLQLLSFTKKVADVTLAYDYQGDHEKALTVADNLRAAQIGATNLAQQAAIDKTELQNAMMGKLTAQMIFQTASTGLSAAAQLELARKMGLVDESTYAATVKIEDWHKELDTKKLTVDQYTTKVSNLSDLLKYGITPNADASRQAIEDLGSAMNLLHNVDVSVSVHHTDTYTTIQNTVNTESQQQAGGTGGGRQHGGSVASGVSYLVGEAGPELFVPRSSGTIVPNSQMTSSGGGDVAQALVQMNALMTNLPHMLARALRDAVQLKQ